MAFARVSDILKQHIENIDNIDVSMLCYRCFGDDKLPKPKLLKGLKPIKSFDLIGKKVNVYDIGKGDLVLYFGTLFSKIASFPKEEDMALPTSVLAKKYNFKKGSYKNFTYPDAWCTIYNRNEGYIIIKRLSACFIELYGIHLPSIVDKVYSSIRTLSLKDTRFMVLGLEPTDADSAEYYRFCNDFVGWLYKCRNKVEFNKK